jgi:RNA polymerase sigma-70 factor (ECF subfamily)
MRRATRRGAVSDEDFVRALYERHGGALLAYTVRLTGDRASAEDIVQETLLRAWRRAEQLAADDRPVRPWLFAVARNLAVDGRRTAKLPTAELDGEALEHPAGVDELDRALEAWQLADALAALRHEHRQVIVETYYRGRSVAEVAAALGIPPGTVKSRAYYGLRSLRLVLEERGWTSP